MDCDVLGESGPSVVKKLKEKKQFIFSAFVLFSLPLWEEIRLFLGLFCFRLLFARVFSHFVWTANGVGWSGKWVIRVNCPRLLHIK